MLRFFSYYYYGSLGQFHKKHICICVCLLTDSLDFLLGSSTEEDLTQAKIGLILNRRLQCGRNFSIGQSLLAEEKYHGSLMCNWDLTSHKTQESPRRAFSMCFNLVHHSPSMFPPEKQETAQVGRKGHLSNKKMALAALVDLCFSVWALPVSGRCFLSARSYRYKSTQESRQAVNCRCHLTNSHSIPGKQDMNGKLFHSSVSGNVYELLTGECEFPQGGKKTTLQRFSLVSCASSSYSCGEFEVDGNAFTEDFCNLHIILRSRSKLKNRHLWL
ncbi:uncharacterized protein [Macaca nemestrina]|uniref:uncharacterized protein isoform X3 n=1 Tax=Macaca nemestrina TaxID=9545 RepID=UPI0039B87B20